MEELGLTENQLKNLSEQIKHVSSEEMHEPIGSESFDTEDERINSPTHYQSYNGNLGIECIDAMRAAFGDDSVREFCKCNAFKYLWRHTSKGLNEDIRKAQWYMKKYLELGGCE